MTPDSASPDLPDPPPPGPDPAGTQLALDRLRGQQHFPNGFAAGAVVAVICAVVWAAITVATRSQIGWMAVGVGVLVGLAVRRFGHGVDPRFGYLGAGMSLLGCGLGNLFAVLGFVSGESGESVLSLWGQLSWAAVPDVMAATFSPMDLVFYGIAIYEGYQFSFRKIEPADLGLTTPAG
jgi:hypothetical protein